MNRQQTRTARRWALASLASVLLLCGAAFACFRITAEDRATAARVRTLIQELGDNYLSENNPAFAALADMGPAAYPELRRILSWQETAPHRLYEHLWTRAPEALRNPFPVPGLRRALQVQTSAVVPDLGPAACRALAAVTAEYLLRDNHTYGATFSLRALYWSVPESPKSTLALSNWLARWQTETDLFGNIFALELWPKVPQLAPLLANWLRNPDAAREAAESLEKLGPDAAFALPLLLEVAESGVAGTNTVPKIQILGETKPLDLNRAPAIRAIGAIGLSNPQVLGVLQRAAADANPHIALSAIESLAQLGQDIDGPVKSFLESSQALQNYDTKSAAERLGTIGPPARAALPWLRKLASPNFQFAPAKSARSRGNLPVTAPAIQAAAIAAIGRIDPAALPEYLDRILADHFAGNWAIVPLMMEASSHRSEITVALMPLLRHKSEIERMKAAVITLKHESGHPKSTSILHAALSNPDSEFRLTAAVYLARAGADMTKAIPIIREGLLANGDGVQTALNAVEAMASSGEIFVPELRQALHSPNPHSRDWAGRVLRRLAPDAMPPIR